MSSYDHDPDEEHFPAMVEGWSVRDDDDFWVPPDVGADLVLHCAKVDDDEDADIRFGPIRASGGRYVAIGGSLELICWLGEPDRQYVLWLKENGIILDCDHPFNTKVS